MRAFLFFPVAVQLFFALVFNTTCRGKDLSPASASGEIPGLEYSAPAWPVLALLKTGENPLWFELGAEGPRLIESPAAASLSPFAPWPNARYLTGILPADGILAMAVNRGGFLALGAVDPGKNPDAANAVLYQIPDEGLWDPYTTESFFIFKGNPSVLLYRNDFFIEPAVPPIEHQIYSLDPQSPVPLSVIVPALDFGGGKEVELLRRGPDGFWYFRARSGPGALSDAFSDALSNAFSGVEYFRIRDLSINKDEGEAEKVSVGDWRNSSRPEEPEKTPPQVSALLKQAAELFPGKTFAVRTSSPDFEGQRFFSMPSASSSSIEENIDVLFCFYNESAALAILPDGRGLYSEGENPEAKPLSLSVLPEGFVYTWIGLLDGNLPGSILVAAWEEQQDAGIGAAGFMVMTFKAGQK